ncbi:hypothetical protein GCM10009792_17030 [Microcella alkalica]|uniref:Ammonia channel protein AmtB n=1 Tax=Microcella alkalica TaxID=355930 RepID=A0A839ECG5_9MICO|nr:hypothetical protein [Microcella alkalica]MBA8847025.1 ammonia channel protein AmtB [Microcella alkalica]
MTSDPLLQLAAALLVLATPVGVLLGTGRLDRGRVLAALVAGAGGAVASIAGDALTGPITDVPARILDAAIAATVTAIVATLAARRLGSVGGVVFAGSWSALVFQPVVGAVVGEFPPLMQSLIGAVDFAGVLATHVAAGAALLVVHLLPAPRRARSFALVAGSVGWPRAVIAAVLVTLGGTAWLVGVERVVDEATGRIVANAVVGIAVAAVTWSLIEKVGWNRLTPAVLVAGAWGGWAAIGIGAPFLAPPALGAAAVIGGAVGSALSGAGARDDDESAPRRSWTLGAIGATATGGIIVALLADGFGLAATGTLVLAAAQLGAVLAVVVIAALGGLVCWAIAWVAQTGAAGGSRSR